MGAGAPGALPKLTLVRSVSADDSPLPTTKSSGFNAAEFDEIVIVGSLKNSATGAVITAYFWSDAKSKFVPDTPGISLTLSGADDAKRVVARVAHAESVFLGVSSLAGGAGERVDIEVGGIPIHGLRE